MQAQSFTIWELVFLFLGFGRFDLFYGKCHGGSSGTVGNELANGPITHRITHTSI